MKSSELRFQGLEKLQDADVEITGGYTSDLLSDVMANLTEGDALITIQAHKNTVAVAALTGASALIFCHGRRPDADTLAAAEKEKIAVFVSSLSQYETTCALANALA
jgi:hypothetical protein